MSNDNRDMDTLFDRAIEATRKSTLDPDQVQRSAEKVWARVADMAEPEQAADDGLLSSCEDYQPLLADFAAKALPEARQMLVEDHVRECLTCRRMLRDMARPTSAAPQPAASRASRATWIPWAVAAALIVGFTFAGLYGTAGYLPIDTGNTATIPVVDGTLFRVTGGESEPIVQGASLAPGDWIRTGRNSGAIVELADGSRVELAPRSELSFYAGWRDTTLQLAHGRMIVNASDQGSGNLFVKTADCDVAVKGTVFSVSHGTKGSRVTVIEGKVHVDGTLDKGTKVLLPGDQVATHNSMPFVPLLNEISWSRNADDHIALLEELVEIRRKLEQIPQPGLRYSTRLLELVPEDTMFYAGVPNLASTLAEAHEVIRQHAADSAVLSEWWTAHMVGTPEEDLNLAFERLRSMGDKLGDEIVVSISANVMNDEPDVLILAELKDADGFVEELRAQLAAEGADPAEMGLRIIRSDDPTQIVGLRDDQVHAWATSDLLAITPHRDRLYQLAEQLYGQTPPSPNRGAFHERIARSYRDGASFIIGADVGRMLDDAMVQIDSDDKRARFEQLGVLDARHVVFERKPTSSHVLNQAVITFDGERHGVAAWLAEPSAMGALDYISPDAHLVAAAVLDEPRNMLAQVLEWVVNDDSEAAAELAEVQDRIGVSFVEDMAAPVGGEFAVAVDGPVLPVPSWKVILEVYDQQHIQATLNRLVSQFNADLQENGFDENWRIAIGEQTYQGRRSYSIGWHGQEPKAHYSFVDGYLIAAPSRPLIDRAIQYKQSGFTLTSSAKFRSLLPEDGHDDFSALFYKNLGPALGPIANRLSGALPPEQAEVLKRLGADAPPSLGFAYGGPDRVTLATTSPPGTELTGLLGLNEWGDMLVIGEFMASIAESAQQ